MAGRQGHSWRWIWGGKERWLQDAGCAGIRVQELQQRLAVKDLGCNRVELARPYCNALCWTGRSCKALGNAVAGTSGVVTTVWSLELLVCWEDLWHVHSTSSGCCTGYAPSLACYGLCCCLCAATCGDTCALGNWGAYGAVRAKHEEQQTEDLN